jgi:hypothetical protein
MTTHNFTKHALLSALIICSAMLSAQTIVEYDGSSTDAQMTLTETGAVNDFSRLIFNHSTDLANRWTIASMSQDGQSFGTLESPIAFAYTSTVRLLLGKNGRLRINNAYTLPNVDGTNGQVLTTDGAGNVSWGAGGSGGSSLWTEAQGPRYSNTGTRFARINSTNGGNTGFRFENNGLQEAIIWHEESSGDLNFTATNSGSARHMVIDGVTQNVGIGLNNTAPTAKLDVKVTGSDGIIIDGDDTGDTRLSLENGGGIHYLFDDDSDGHNLKIQSNNDFVINTGGVNERFRIEDTGDAKFTGGDFTMGGTLPRLFLINDGAADTRIGFGDNGLGASDAAIFYDSSTDMLEIGTNTNNGNVVIAGDGKVGVNETNAASLEAQMTIKANAGNTVTPSTLDLAENNNSGYPVLRYTNFAIPGSFTVEANSAYNSSITGAADFRIRFSEDGTETNKKDILSAVYAFRNEAGALTNSQDERVGIRTADPLTDLHLIHKSGTTGHGLRIENESGGNWWKFYTAGGADQLQLRNNTSTAVIGFFTTNGIYNASDKRLKKNIETMPYGLKDVMNLKALRYNYKSDEADADMSLGFIAQDLNKVIPELVLYDKESDQYAVNYAGMSVVAINAIQEQQQQINDLKAENEELKNQIATILTRLDAEGK